LGFVIPDALFAPIRDDRHLSFATDCPAAVMLARLSIRDIVLIDRLDIDFGSGLAALTGETGAGKSILLDAFALALGALAHQGGFSPTTT
jgi:AAA15 family ATPase/GTPase